MTKDTVHVKWLMELLSKLVHRGDNEERFELYHDGSGCVYNIESGKEKTFKNIRELIRILKNKKVYGNKT